jgi:predicted regulator of amino acid metabolism with ACT domain
VIGQVTSALGASGINISDIHVGRSATGEAALMAIATDSLVPAEIVARIVEQPGVQSARAIDLG